MTATLPSSIHAYLAAFVARRRRLALWRAVGWGLAMAMAWMLASCLLDRAARLGPTTRLTLLLLDLVIAVIMIAPSLYRRFRHELDCSAASADIERLGMVFNQRLQTVVTQSLSPEDQQGSPDLLAHLSDEVQHDITAHPVTKLIPVSCLAAPWMTCAMVLLLVLGIGIIPRVRLTSLLARFAAPLLPTPPVTTTQLSVDPGNAAVLQGQKLVVWVTAAPPGTDPPLLSRSSDGHTWISDAMDLAATSASGAAGNNTATSSDRYSFSFPSVDREFRYTVSAGDAVTPVYRVTMNGRPAVAEFRARLNYPAYTHKAALIASNTDGVFEAPAGTEAIIDIIATEPLSAATLYVGPSAVAMNRTNNAAIRQCHVTIDRDAPLRLALTSTTGLNGTGPPGMAMRAVPDQEPAVVLLQPADNLRLTPRDVLPIDYRATDDYGIESLSISAQVNTSAPRQVPIRITADPRYQAGVAPLDLAALGDLRIGDSVRVSLVASDAAGHRTTSEVRTITISPHSIDVKTHLRLAELQEAARLVDSMAQCLRTAASTEATDVSSLDAIRQQLADANDAADGLRVALLRAIVHSQSPEMSRELASCADDSVCAMWDANAGLQIVGTASQDLVRERLLDALKRCEPLRRQLATIADGQLAEMTLAERDNLKAIEPTTQPRSDAANTARLSSPKSQVARIRDDTDSAIRDLGLDPQAATVDADLTAKARTADAMIATTHDIDFDAAARAWIATIGAESKDASPLDLRLSMASQTEAVRIDADLIRARDWELAGRVATLLAADPHVSWRDQFAGAIAALQNDHALNRGVESAHNPAEVAAIRASAAQARKKLSSWAGPTPPPTEEDPLADALTEEDLLLRASAETASRQYDRAAQDDSAALRYATSRPGDSSIVDPTAIDTAAARRQAAQSLAAARQLDQLHQQQNQLQNEASSRQAPVESLAARQQGVADALKQLGPDTQPAEADQGDNVVTEALTGNGESDSRTAEVAAIQSVAERLAAMPEALSDLEQATNARAEAARQVAAADNAVGAAADGEQRRLAQHVADQAGQNLDAAIEIQEEAQKSVDPDEATGLSTALAKYAQDTDLAVAAIDHRLVPALQELAQAASKGDPAAAKEAAAQARKVIDTIQTQLRLTQNAMIDRDPLASARFYTQAAARDLARANATSASRQQQRAAAALNKAWDRSVHEAATARLSQLSRYSPLLQLDPAERDLTSYGSNVATSQPGWGRLRSRPAPSMNPGVKHSDPPGYEESIKAYFEALSRQP